MIYWGREWHSLDTYFQFKEISGTPTVVPQEDEIRVYAKNKGGTAALYLQDPAGSEREIGPANTVTGTGAAGQVAFWSSASVLTGENDLFWDSSNNWLGLGTAAPAFRLELQGATNANANIVIKEASADTTTPGLALLKTRGTLGSEAATNSGDGIGNLSFGGWTNAYKFNAARIEGFAGSLWTATNSESYITFATTPNASVTRAERFRIGPSGQWGIGGATYGSSGNLFQSGGASAAPSWLDHTIDFLSQYALLAGRSGGQTLKGGTASGDDLTLQSTAHATRGNIHLGSSSTYDELNTWLGIGQTTPLAPIHISAAAREASAIPAKLFIDGTEAGTVTNTTGIDNSLTHAPTANVGARRGLLNRPVFNPDTGVTITTAYVSQYQIKTGNGAGTISSALGFVVDQAYGTLKPTKVVGATIANLGSAGITTAIGIEVVAQSGATNNYVFELPSNATDPTGGGGAATGRIPCLIGGVTRYIAYY